MNVTYVKYNTPGKFITFPRLLNPALYNNIGTTYEDYLNDKWVKLSREQIKYKNEHPNASVYETLCMNEDVSKLDMSLTDARAAKIASIKTYDKSRDIEVFYVNNEPHWWDKNKRMSVFHRLDVESKLGKTETTLWFDDTKIITSIQKAYDFLYRLEEYAIACLDNTNNHIIEIEKAYDINAILNFDYTIGYPDKIRIEL